MTKILLADDHIIVREGLKKILDRESDLQITGEAENTNEVLEFFKKNTCDVLILDINLPGKSGLDIMREIKKSKPNVKILILSIYPEDSFAINAFELGASGYLTKDASTEILLKAIRKISHGGKYVSESLADKLASRITTDWGKSPHENLSKREIQVLLLIGKGKTTSEIAKELSLGYNTISTYRARILDKMGMNSNAALIHYTITHNLLE